MTILTPPKEIVYPDSDGEPMADNTLQFEWISLLKWEIEALFANDPDVFVAGDLLWYPVQGDNRTRVAPDAMVAFGRPKGYRGSYMQWIEAGIAPQVVFEVLSPGNDDEEMARKRNFYERFGVEEYYKYDPDNFKLEGWQRSPGARLLRPIPLIDGWVSPRLGIRFDAPGNREMVVYRPDRVPFRTPLEVRQGWEQERIARELAESERDRAEVERDEAQAERERLAAKLRALGIDPDQL